MEYRQLGRSGLTVSAIGLGCNNFGTRVDADQATAVVHAALDAGVTFFDTAEMYGGGKSEEFLGAALAGRRHEAIVATKFGGARSGSVHSPGSRANVFRACDDSLRRLGTDHIDLYYQHFTDPNTPVEETLEALTDLVAQGKVRYVASSNVDGWMVADADHLARERGLQRFTGCQVEWSLLQRAVETEVVPACNHFGVGVVAYYPLASGLLTGKYRRDESFPEGTRLASSPYFASVATDENWDKVERLTAAAAARGHTILELAVSWLLAQDGVSSVLTGATSAQQVAANVEAATWQLDTEDLGEVATAFAGTA